MALVAGKLSLHDLAESGDFNSLKQELNNHPESVTEVDKCGKTLLHRAALGNQLECFKLILSIITQSDDKMVQKVLEFRTTKSKSNILHYVASLGNLSIITFLFEGTDTQTKKKMYQFLIERNQNGKLPAHSAIKGKNKDVFEYLYKKDENMHNLRCATSKGETYFTLAAGTGDVKLVDYFFRNELHFPRRILPNILFTNGLKGGSIDILEYIDDKKKQLFQFVEKSNYLPRHIFRAIDSNKVGPITFLRKKIDNIEFTRASELLSRSSPKIQVSPPSYAAYKCNLDAVQFFIENFEEKIFSAKQTPNILPIWFAATSSREILELIFAKCSNDQILSTYSVSTESKEYKWNIFHFATAFCKNDESFCFLYDKFNENQNLNKKLNEFLSLGEKSVVELACAENNLQVLQFIREKIKETDKFITNNIDLFLKSAAKRKHLQILVYLQNEFSNCLNYSKLLTSVATWCNDECFFKIIACKATNNHNEALKLALEFGNFLTAKYLLDTIIDIKNTSIFHFAAKGGSIDCLKYVIQKLGGKNSELVQKIKDSFIDDNKFKNNNCSVTALHLAVYFQHQETVFYLLDELSVNPNEYITGYPTPLHFACAPVRRKPLIAPNIEIVNLLINYGAWKSMDISADMVFNVYGYDRTPFDCAQTSEVRKLLEEKFPSITGSKFVIPLQNYYERRFVFISLMVNNDFLLYTLFYSISDPLELKNESGNFSIGQEVTFDSKKMFEKQLKTNKNFKNIETSFLHEVGILSTIQHPNCCQLIHASYDKNGKDKNFYLLLERLDCDLETYLRTSVYKESDRYRIALDIVQGLIYLHAR